MIYDVVSVKNINEFVDQVNERLAEGWIPIGGIFQNDTYFYQALIKEKGKGKPIHPK